MSKLQEAPVRRVGKDGLGPGHGCRQAEVPIAQLEIRDTRRCDAIQHGADDRVFGGFGQRRMNDLARRLKRGVENQLESPTIVGDRVEPSYGFSRGALFPAIQRRGQQL